MKTLRDLQPGDRVLKMNRSNVSGIGTVERTTKTQIILEGDSRYRKRDGDSIGEYSFGWIKAPEDGEIEEFLKQQDQQRKEFARKRKEEREALRGTPLGYLTACREAISERRQEDDNPILEHALWVVAEVQSQMSTMQSRCSDASEYFQSCAEDLKMKASGSQEKLFSIDSRRITEAHAAYNSHSMLCKIHIPVVHLVASVLEVEPKELLEPFASTKQEEREVSS